MSCGIKEKDRMWWGYHGFWQLMEVTCGPSVIDPDIHPMLQKVRKRHIASLHLLHVSAQSPALCALSSTSRTFLFCSSSRGMSRNVPPLLLRISLLTSDVAEQALKPGSPPMTIPGFEKSGKTVLFRSFCTFCTFRSKRHFLQKQLKLGFKPHLDVPGCPSFLIFSGK